MRYTFNAKLTGEICEHCVEPLAKIPVRLYQVAIDGETVKAVASRGRKTFKALNAEQVAEKSDRLLAEATTDDSGAVIFDLGDDYDGGPFEVDVVIAPVATGDDDEKEATPQQISLTTIQPRWRRTEQGQVAAWDHVLSPHRWCAIKEALGFWTICGCVYVCERDGDVPVPGVKVIAFDRDWLQDDELGSAITNATGCFQIHYTPADFLPGTFINVENPFFPWSPPSRPDVYFRVETQLGVPLLVEDPHMGRTPGREDVGACLCVKLCVDRTPPVTEEYFSHFTHIGSVKYSIQVDSGSGGSGLTTGDSRAFHRTIKLNGLLSKTLNGGPAEFRFETRELPAGPWTPVLDPQIASLKIGTWQKWTGVGTPPWDEKDVILKGADGPTTKGVPVGGDGWIEVPQWTGLFSADGHFQPNGDMIRLDTRTLAAWANLDMATQVAGNTSVQPLATNELFGIRMVVRNVGNAATEQFAGECETLAIENTLYSNINRHPAWMAQHLDDQLAVCMVDIAQLLVTGCDEITNLLEVPFTAIHPNLGSVSLSMAGPGGPYNSWTMPAAVAGQHVGTATPNIVVANLQPCAYIVTLTVPLLLTTGDNNPDPLHDQIAFCKA